MIQPAMQSVSFYIVKTNGQEVIRDHKTQLQIKISPLDNKSFAHNDSEIVLYGIGRDNLLAFETVNIRAYCAELVAFALAWYVDYIEQPEMFITREDPRVSFRLKRA
jgi:hypothetical protein